MRLRAHRDPALTGRRRRRLAVVGTLVLLAGVVVGWWWVRHATTSTPVSVDQAVQRYEQQAPSIAAPTAPPVTTSPSTTSPTSTAPSTTSPISTAPSTTSPAPSTTTAAAMVAPSPGVYVYATTGGDAVDAIGGAHHDYPAVSTLTVTPTACGVDERWDVLVERWITWHRCASAAGWQDLGRTNFDSFFGQSLTDEFRCDGQPRPTTGAPGTTWSTACSGPVHETHRGTVIGIEDVTVGAVTVSTQHVRLQVDDGVPADHQTFDTWYLAGGALVVRQQADVATTRSTFAGTVHYTERYVLALTSLTPKG